MLPLEVNVGQTGAIVEGNFNQVIGSNNRLRDIRIDNTSTRSSSSRTRRADAPPPPPSVRELEGNGTEATTEDEQCVVCLHNTRDIVFLPCGHVACCVECARELVIESNDQHGGECPTCRAPIRAAHRIFM